MEKTYNKEHISGKLIAYFIFSLILNCLSNSLTIQTNMGSAIWTATGVNLSHLLHVGNGTAIFALGLLVAVFNEFFSGKFDARRFFGSVLYAFMFSYLIQGFDYFWIVVGISKIHAIVPRIILDVVGLAGIAIAISIYQRTNILMHPNDYLSYLLRYKVCKGNATTAQWLSYVPAIVVLLICVTIDHSLYSVGFGTVWAFLTQGTITGWADTHIFPKLKHHFRGEFKGREKTAKK